MKYLVEHSLKKDYLDQMLLLDSESFCTADSSTYETCMAWYEKNPDIYTILLNDEEKVIGYINFAPLTQTAYDLFRQGRKFDMQLSKADILPFAKNSVLNCLFMSIVIHPKYRHTDAIKKITKAFYEKIERFKKDKNITIKTILADCVSADGARYLSNQGFTPLLKTSKNSFLYEKVIM